MSLFSYIVKSVPLGAAWLVGLALMSACPLAAQTSTQADPAILPERNYVRPVSLGISLPVLIQPATVGGFTSQNFPEQRLAVESSATASTHRVGGGAVLQIALPRSLALATSVSARTSSHRSQRITYEGIDNPLTIIDERRITRYDEDTSARLWTVNLMMRRYNLYHNEEGHRWFIQAGPALRLASKVRSATTITFRDEVTCCTLTPNPVANKWAKGVVAGIGGQFIDEIGLRLVPEVRYTRWFSRNFDNLSVGSRVDQIEAIVSITF